MSHGSSTATISKSKGSLRNIFLAAVLLFLLLIVFFVHGFYSALNWMEGIEVAAPRVYPEAMLSAEEKKELVTLGKQFRQAVENKFEMDFWLTVPQANLVFTRLLEQAAKRGNPRIYGRFQYEGEQLQLFLSVPKGGNFYNLDLKGNLWAFDRKLKWRLDSLSANEEEAPWLAHVLFRRSLNAMVQTAKLKPEDQAFSRVLALKGLEYKNERVHLTIDGKYLSPSDLVGMSF